MRQTFNNFLIVAGVSFAGLVICLVLSLLPMFKNPVDPYVLFRYSLLRLTAVAIAAPVLIGLMIATDYVNPGDWMDGVGSDPKACSYIMASVVLVIGAILCWA